MNKTKLWMIAATLVCGMLLAACSADDNPAVGPTTELLNDGVWTGSGEGRSGTIVVKMTVENHEITDIVVVSQSESSFAQEALNEMVARALQKQGLMSMEVDGVTGATLTSTGVIDAVNMAILAAQGKDPATKNTYTDGSCDIVVVGAGGAGLSAAVEAASHGDLQIIVLEKQGVLGGNTNYSTGGINAAGTEAQQVLGINDSPELFFHPAGYRDLDGVKEKLKQRAMQAASRFMQELYQKANITDNRYLFF